MNKIIIIIILFTSSLGFCQDTNITSAKYTAYNKGKVFFYWGGNRDGFSKTDIRFTGNGYDFTLHDVEAIDKPKGWHIDYINPGRMTIPQTNFRLGYFLNDHWAVSLGLDHMKYVMVQNQTAKISGIYPAIYNSTVVANGAVNLTDESFLTFEHTDGLNYVHAEIARVDDLSKWIGLPNTDKFQLNITEGLAAGVLYPKTNTMLFSKPRHDDFHVSGYGVSAKAGLNFLLYKHFFIQTELKVGYINMPDIRTTFDPADRASQQFMFIENMIAFGGIFKL
jgi:hypothetical protein